jgi:hypothetical protein
MLAGLLVLLLAAVFPFPESGDRMAPKPHFGHTRHGLAVHLHTHDHLPEGSAYQRFNKRVAIWLTKNVGSMTAFWLFTLASMTVAPSCLFAAGYIHWKAFITTFGFELLATLILSTWLELALMPAIMVGQNLQSAASDARAAKQFEDVEQVRNDLTTALDRLDEKTEGGVKAVLDAVNALAAREAMEQKVQVQASGSLSGAQVKQIATEVQARLMEQAKRNPGGPRYGQ